MTHDLSPSGESNTKDVCTDMVHLNLLLEQLIRTVKLNAKHFGAHVVDVDDSQSINLVSNSPSPSPLSSISESKEASFSPVLSQASACSLPAVINALSLNPAPLPTQSALVASFDSYQFQRIVSNILVMLFLQHPTGVLESELPVFYQQVFGEPLVIFQDLKYCLSVHKAILCTQTANRGTLFSLNPDQIECVVAQFEPQMLRSALIYHIQKIFRCYPNGIACSCFQQVFYNMIQLRLSKFLSCWVQFVQSIPSIYCINIGGSNMFIQMDDLNTLAVTKKAGVSMTRKEIKCFLMRHLNASNILKHCYGYDELLMALFREHEYINSAQMEQMFYALYKCRLVHEAPFVQSKLNGICDSYASPDGVTLYNLSSPYVTYMKDNVDGFNAIFKRELTFNSQGNKHPRCVKDVSQSIIKSPFSTDHCTLFLGGFCKGDSSEALERELNDMGVEVVSCSGILYRSYGWAYVTLSSAKECDYLLSISPIYILRRSIDVRPYLDRYKAYHSIDKKPSKRQMMQSIRRFIIDAKSESLSIAELQSRLFRKYSYRISGPEIIQLVTNHPNVFYVRNLPGQYNSPRIYVCSND
eukprot:274846_1